MILSTILSSTAMGLGESFSMTKEPLASEPVEPRLIEIGLKRKPKALELENKVIMRMRNNDLFIPIFYEDEHLYTSAWTSWPLY
jgi:hypothetical protein